MKSRHSSAAQGEVALRLRHKQRSVRFSRTRHTVPAVSLFPCAHRKCAVVGTSRRKRHRRCAALTWVCCEERSSELQPQHSLEAHAALCLRHIDKQRKHVCVTKTLHTVPAVNFAPSVFLAHSKYGVLATQKAPQVRMRCSLVLSNVLV